VSEVEEQNKRYYDREACVYEDSRYSSIKGRRVEEFHKYILDELLVSFTPKDARVLELGCGTGRLLEHLAHNGWSLSGIDISPGMLEIARSKFSGGTKEVILHESLATDVPYPNDYFDSAYSILVLNLMPNLELVLDELSRVLKSGGTLVFNMPNLSSIYFPGGIYVNARGRTVGKNSAGHRYSSWYTTAALVSLLGKSGFSVEAIVGQPPFLRYFDNSSPIYSKFGLIFAKSVYIRATKIGEQ
jgi:ubiquinone/menaquinone biosynthesis C-methylase UbiE